MSIAMDDIDMTGGIGDDELVAASGDVLPATSVATEQESAAVRHISDASSSNSSSVTKTDTSVQRFTEEPTATGRPSILLYLSCNPDYLSPFQCCVRKNVELFEAREADVNTRVKGRNKPIVLGQVGIRCWHCRHVYPISEREKGAVYYPHTLAGIYQASQILSQGHLMESGCKFVPDTVREELKNLKVQKSYATAGKDYWAQTAAALGVFEDQFGLRFEERLPTIMLHH